MIWEVAKNLHRRWRHPSRFAPDSEPYPLEYKHGNPLMRDAHYFNYEKGEPPIRDDYLSEFLQEDLPPTDEERSELWESTLTGRRKLAREEIRKAMLPKLERMVDENS